MQLAKHHYVYNTMVFDYYSIFPKLKTLKKLHSQTLHPDCLVGTVEITKNLGHCVGCVVALHDVIVPETTPLYS
jgi:hypothetical protein